MDDITAVMNGRNKELVEMTEKVLRTLQKVEEKGLKLPARIWRRVFRNAATKELPWKRVLKPCEVDLSHRWT